MKIMKRIGVLYPSAGVTDRELWKMVPEEISLHITRIPLEKPTTEEYAKMADFVQNSLKLLTDARVDIIAFCCTAGSLVGGPEYDRMIIDRINRATGLPSTTTSTAIISALRFLNVYRFSIVSPYSVEFNEIEKAFFENVGFKVVSHRGLDLSDILQQYQTDPQRWYDLVKEVQSDECDSYLLSCGGIRVVDIIESLESELGKPVISSNQALIWHCLKKMDMLHLVSGPGTLMAAGANG
jgi:maleate isomerase